MKAGTEHIGHPFVSQKLILSADAAAVALDAKFLKKYLLQVEIKTTSDNAVTFSIASHLGATLFTTTTTAATTGEVAQPTAYYAITGIPTYTLSGLGSGSATIVVTATI